MSGALSGIRIVDLTTMISGPVATQMLADQGADVIKVESPEGDTMRYLSGKESVSPSFLSANRNKRSVVLDIKREPGRRALLKLIATADVLVENFRPGTATRLGLSETAVRSIKPDIVFVSINGFGETGPYVHKRVYDPIIQAASGIAAIQADRETGRPQLVQMIIADQITSMTAAQAITAALLARARSGEGQHVKLAMLDAMVSFLWVSALGSLTLPPPEGGARRGPGRPERLFETADGYITTVAVSQAEWQGLCTALEKPEWLDDERFATAAARNANDRLFSAEIQSVLRQRTSREWLALLDQYDVPCAPVLGFEDLLKDPQIAENGIIQECQHSEFGSFRQARPPALFSATPSAIRTHAPSLGQHTREVLSELGLSGEEIDALTRSGG
ncbi:CaiB/BaiF CoA transferase family protein [Bradyrhizobium erythrophlei]|uniref:CaiB/BaiF CoA transferase family protein n=1 Tax=Bradyrhizobium erythrophlei TaxID=1437360 RepID=UPI0035E8AEE0